MIHDEAEKIFNYLPIRKSETENNYIMHLWESYTTLANGTKDAEAFSIMPFHLLFILALQYKVLRLFKTNPRNYTRAFMITNYSDRKAILEPTDPYVLSLLKESDIINLLELNGMERKTISDIKKKTVVYRNDTLAHAKGYIEVNTEQKITDYLSCLSVVHTDCPASNNAVFKQWIAEVQKDDDMEQFFELRYLDSCISTMDLGDILKKFLESDLLTDEQWSDCAHIGIDYALDTVQDYLYCVMTDEKSGFRGIEAQGILADRGVIDIYP